MQRIGLTFCTEVRLIIIIIFFSLKFVIILLLKTKINFNPLRSEGLPLCVAIDLSDVTSHEINIYLNRDAPSLLFVRTHPFLSCV